MRRTFFMSLAIFSLLSSCRKDEPTTGPVHIKNGRVQDAVTLNLIPYAKVFLMRQPSEAETAMGMHAIKMAYADSSGHFSMDFIIEDGYEYFFRAESPYYFEGENDKPIPPGDIIGYAVMLRPMGYVRFRLINEPPMEPVYFSVNNTGQRLYTNASDTSLYVYGLGGDSATVYWNLNSGNEYKQDHAKIFFPVLDTAEFVIRY